MPKILHLAAVAIAGPMLLACSRAPAEPSTTSTATPDSATASAPPAPPPSPSPSASGPSLAVRWDDPPRWVRRPASSPMRAAEYSVPRAPADSADGECTVITFGPGQGGGVDDNVDRWIRQFSDVSGTPVKAKRQIGSMTVTRVEVAGSYHPMMMPGMGAKAAALPNARLVGAIVEAPSGLWFFKLTGPDATVKAAAAEFDSLLGSLRAG